jgi:glutathione S-transferase
MITLIPGLLQRAEVERGVQEAGNGRLQEASERGRRWREAKVERSSAKSEAGIAAAERNFYLQKFFPGANPTILNYNASVVKIYNALSSLARFENKNIFF